MKIRSGITIFGTIIGSALALIALFAALPALAQTDNNATINNLTYDGLDSSNNIKLSWDTVANTHSVKLQIQGGGIVDTWYTYSDFTTATSGSSTNMTIQDLDSYRVGNASFRFRIKIQLTYKASTPWAYVDES